MVSCIVCRASSPSRLCERCRNEIDTQPQLVPEQLSAEVEQPVNAVVVDLWGRSHALGVRTIVGRQAGPETLALCDASVSRNHAVIERESEHSFVVRDLGSTNGTFVRARRVEDSHALHTGDTVHFGHVGLYFLSPPPPRAHEIPHVVASTVRSKRTLDADIGAFHRDDPDSDTTHVGAPTLDLAIVEPTGGGGGFLRMGDRRCLLTPVQLDFVRVIIDRMRRERDDSELVRGFVRSSELIASLGWETPHPNEAHVKQLVRRTRRALEKAGMGDLIEARHRLGYRIRALPR